MNNPKRVKGFVAPTAPPSTPLDTLKALVLRNIENMDYVLTRLDGSDDDPGDLADFVDHMRQMQLRALAEHIPVARDELLEELRYIHPDGMLYADGSPVSERWTDEYGVMDFYPRYDDRSQSLKEFNAWVASNRAKAETRASFDSIVDGIELSDD